MSGASDRAGRLVRVAVGRARGALEGVGCAFRTAAGVDAVGPPSLSGRSSDEPTPDRVFGVAVIAGFLVAWRWWAPAGVALGSLIVALHRLRRRRRLDATTRAARRGIADALPLLRLAVDAGLTTRAALALVAPWLAGPLGEEVRGLCDRVARGRSLAVELDLLAFRWDGAAAPLCRVLAAAERYGAPLAGPLERVEAEARRAQQLADESAARRLPVALLAPLVLTVLPGFVLLAVVPLLVGSIASLRG
ncbi:MAG: type II secretion system F family protein [Acidimicrobiia bacterium]|nr:type II secretion system F family protein [Acidimicrobiia bacterium]